MFLSIYIVIWWNMMLLWHIKLNNDCVSDLKKSNISGLKCWIISDLTFLLRDTHCQDSWYNINSLEIYHIKLSQNWQKKNQLRTFVKISLKKLYIGIDNILIPFARFYCKPIVKNFAPRTTATIAFNFIYDSSTLHRYLHTWQYFSDLSIFSTHEKFSF